ncbi:protein disulfide isomerase pTAC5, chloroplastic-like [Tasmannia lanceolata]|uniref:protein disulfide isomerase pTAC5, chloroplastic-like n=1 Tax=Tasmannia lanceolata TaxID=3420 RepID=UPI004063F53A
MASSLPLSFQILPPLYQGFQTSLKSTSFPFQPRRNPNPNPKPKPKPLHRSPISACLSSSNPSSSSSWEREEARWIREEQRWIREEQRWIREESRWKSEREFLLREISSLKLRIETLEREKSSQGASISDTVANLGSLLQALKDKDFKSVKNQIPESGMGPRPILLEEAEVKEMVSEEIRGLKEIRVSESDKEVEKKKKKKALRKGSEGKEILAMQEALQKLGFYSGEEDMEYSTFSSGTERAVKTWQATLGASEDGIMTSELLERLFMELEMVDIGLKDGANGAAFAPVARIAEIQKTVVKESDVAEVDVSQHRVFLLGENRWEEPSRLTGSDIQIIGNNAGAATKCLTCRGEGHLLCTECDGTGEPNIEEQFLEWVDEGAKCPYCEGMGYTTCDACEGKRMIPI